MAKTWQPSLAMLQILEKKSSRLTCEEGRCIAAMLLCFCHMELLIIMIRGLHYKEFLMTCCYLRGSLHPLKLGALTFVRPPLAKILQTVLQCEKK